MPGTIKEQETDALDLGLRYLDGLNEESTEPLELWLATCQHGAVAILYLAAGVKMELEPLPKEIERSVMMSSVNEIGNRMEENRNLIKQWIACQPHLPSATYDERILDLFLRGCKHNLERAKKKIDMYFTIRTLYPDLFAQRDPFDESVDESLQSFHVAPLPKPTEDGYRITMHKYVTADPAQFDARSVFRTMFMIADIRLAEETPIVGDIFLFDVQNITAAHFAKIVTPLLKYTLHCVQEAYPQRLKEIHLLNAPPMIDRVVTFFKQFLKEKMRNRFQIHSEVNSLYEFIPKTHLPEDYGGELPALKQIQGIWTKKLKSYKNYFEQQETVKSDESKRIKGSSAVVLDQQLFGTEGAFRKLNID